MAPRTERCTVCKKPIKRNCYLCCASCKNNYCIEGCSQVSTKRLDVLEKSRRATWKCNVCTKAKRSSTSTPMKAKYKSKCRSADPEFKSLPKLSGKKLTDTELQSDIENVGLHNTEIIHIQTHNSFESLSISDNCDDVEERPVARIDNYVAIEEMEKKNKILQEQLDFAQVQIEILLSEKTTLLQTINKKDLKISSLRHALDKQHQSVKSHVKNENVNITKQNLCTKKIAYNNCVTADKETQEDILASDNLINMTDNNAAQYDSSYNYTNCDSRPAHTHSPAPAPQPPAEPIQHTIEHTRVNNNITTHVYCDRLGKDFGPLLNVEVHSSVINHCMPNATYSQVINSIVNNEQIHSNTNIVILIGNSQNIRKKDIISGFDRLFKLGFKKIMHCAFPYSASLSTEQNDHIHSMNTLLYNMTCNCDNQLIFFDVNKFINNFTLTKDTMYLRRSIRLRLAKLIAYNLNNLDCIQCTSRKTIHFTDLVQEAPCLGARTNEVGLPTHLN